MKTRAIAGAMLAVVSLPAFVGAGVSRPDTAVAAQSRLATIRERGVLGCGIEPAVPGFADVDRQGRYRGFDIDICRAIAAAILGSADKVNFIRATSLGDFLGNDAIDIVSRRLTWELRREGASSLLFGPITFYDGQSFLLGPSVSASGPRQLANTPVCVAGGTNFELNLGTYFDAAKRPLKKVVLESAHDYAGIAARLDDGRCRVYTGDISDLGAIRSKVARPERFRILPHLISKEPLAPVVRDDDPRFFSVVRWTVLALIAAEELGVSSKNADAMRTSDNLDVRRLLGTQPGNGAALGLDERWAYFAIKDVGNYGEVFDRNLGARSAIRLDRGLNKLVKDGGLMYAPPMR